MYVTSSDVQIYKFIRVCTSNYHTYFSCAIYIPEGILLAFGAFLAFETRKVRSSPVYHELFFVKCMYQGKTVFCFSSLINSNLDQRQFENIGQCNRWLLRKVHALFKCYLFCLLFIGENNSDEWLAPYRSLSVQCHSLKCCRAHTEPGARRASGAYIWNNVRYSNHWYNTDTTGSLYPQGLSIVLFNDLTFISWHKDPTHCSWLLVRTVTVPSKK